MQKRINVDEYCYNVHQFSHSFYVPCTVLLNLSKVQLPSVTMVQLKEQLPVLLEKEKLLNKFHWGKNSYYKMQTPLTPTHLPKIATINKNQNINTETNISKKLTGCVKRDTFDTFYEFVLENFKEKNIDGLQRHERQRLSEKKMQPLENEVQNFQNVNKFLKDEPLKNN